MALDIKPIEDIRNDLLRIQGEVVRKDSLITSLSSEKTGLLSERQQLTEQLTVAVNSLEVVKNENLSATEALKRQIDNLSRNLDQHKIALQAREAALIAKEKEVTELRGKYAAILEKGSSSETVLLELSELRIQNEFHKNQLLSRNQYFQQVSIELERFRADTARLEAEKDAREKVLKAEQDRRAALEQELTAVRGRAEFSAVELSGYLNNAIDSFNSQKNLADSSVNYIISELQVDLKAGIGTTAGTSLTMVAPSQAQLTEQGLSSFRFTIRAVPQTTEVM
ncbi:MAG: hypothetical protein H7Y05_15110 [Steroidobacteraceae bacterium]|nr:hypothetical protein [Deltaproteobacteria bacterium]